MRRISVRHGCARTRYARIGEEVGGPQGESGELFPHELADLGAVGATCDLRHHVRHDTAEVTETRRAVLGDRVVDDLLELVLAERLRHELGQHLELEALRVRLLLAPRGAKRLLGLGPALALALQHLELLLVVQRPLELLLRRAQAVQDQAQRVAPLGVALPHRLLQLALDSRDQAHSGIPSIRPPRMCQCRWKIVWPPPRPTLTSTRESSS